MNSPPSKIRAILYTFIVGVIFILLAWGFIRWNVESSMDKGLIEESETSKFKIIGLVIIAAIILSSLIIYFAFKSDSKIKKNILICLAVIPSGLAWIIYLLRVTGLSGGGTRYTPISGGIAIYGLILGIFYLIFAMIIETLKSSNQ